jgi:hypothetical protein
MAQVVPKIFLKMSPAERELLRTDSACWTVFQLDELRRVSNPETGFVYFMENYAVHQPASGSPPEPLLMWPYQPRMAAELQTGEDVICLKSRRVGFTLITCHYMLWIAALKEGTEGAKCLALSKNREAANEIIDTIKMINACLPEFLRPAIGADGVDPSGRRGKENQSMITFAERGSYIRSLPANSSRSYTATVLFIDEIAWLEKPEEAWIAASPTTEGGGQIIVGSTGNGKSGRGALLYKLWNQAETESIMIPVFVSWRDRGDRDASWYEHKRKQLMDDDKLQQEYPETPDQAFAGDAEGLVFSGTGLAAVERKGQELDNLLAAGELPPAKNDSIEVAIDWGLNSAAAILYNMAGFGTYVLDEIVSASDDPEMFSIKVLERAQEYAERTGATVDRAYYDAAGAQQMKSFKRIAGGSVRITAIPFSKYKLRTISFIKTLVRRTKADESIAWIAISPRCSTTLSQMRDAKSRENGDIVKGNDHSIDAVIAGVAIRAVEWDKQNQPD